MWTRIRRRLGYANVLATIALFLSLGGTATALVVTGAMVADESLTDDDIADNSLDPAIRKGAIDSVDIASDAVIGGRGGDVSDNTISPEDESPRPAVYAYTTTERTNQPSGVFRFEFDAERFDQTGRDGGGEIHSTTSDPWRFVVPRDGFYHVMAQVLLETSFTTMTVHRGTPCGNDRLTSSVEQRAGSAVGITPRTATIARLKQGEVLSVCAFVVGPWNLRRGAQFSYFAMYFLGD